MADSSPHHPLEIWQAAVGNVLVQFREVLFAGHPAPPPSRQSGDGIFRVEIMSGRRVRRVVYLKQILDLSSRHGEQLSEQAWHLFVTDLIEQIRRYERGNSLNNQPLDLPESGVPSASSMLMEIVRELWPESVGALMTDSYAWPLAPAMHKANITVIFGRHLRLVPAAPDPTPVSEILNRWVNLYETATSQKCHDARFTPRPRQRRFELGPWELIYNSDSVTVTYNCGLFLLQSPNGTWFRPPNSVNVSCKLDHNYVHALAAGLIQPSDLLSRLTANAYGHPHVSSDSQHLCFGGANDQLAKALVRSHNKRCTSWVIWALLTGASLLKRGYQEGASPFRPLEQSSWISLTEKEAQACELPRYPFKR